MPKSLTVDDILSSSGRYPGRKIHAECTDEVKANAARLCPKVNAFCEELGWEDPDCSSGFRPSNVNAKTKGASKQSKHMKAEATDLKDGSLKWGNFFHQSRKSTEKLLEKHGLYMEDPLSTRGWIHVSDVPPKSGKRIYIPF